MRQRPSVVPVPVERELLLNVSDLASRQVISLQRHENVEVEEPGYGVFFCPLLDVLLRCEPSWLGPV